MYPSVLKQETAWLGEVLAEAERQYQEACQRDDEVKDDALDTQRELWEGVGSIAASDGLDKLVDFLEFINIMQKQKRSHGILSAQKAKYEKMLNSPYFGRIDFQMDAEASARPYYIGPFMLMTNDNRMMVYDWRAPVSGMFYDDEIGPASFASPRGTISGTLSLKRQYRIARGKLDYCFDSSLKIDDEVLQQILAQHTDGRMATIVSSIQREQNRAIRNEAYRHLIIEGVAGSGKTSVALHRIAYLLYRHRDTITAKNIIIFSPNSVFGDYIANVLPELGEENMLQTTFEAFLHGALKLPGKQEQYHDRMEYILSNHENPAHARRMTRIRFKSGLAFRDTLQTFARLLAERAVSFPDLICGGTRIASTEELARLYSYDYAAMPYLQRFEKLHARMVYLLDGYETRRAAEIANEITAAEGFIDRGELRRRSRAIAKQETQNARQEAARLTQVTVTRVYTDFLTALPELLPGEDAAMLSGIVGDTLESIRAGQFAYEDQIALLYLQGILGGLQKTSQIRFVVIDEAQDYSPLQYEILRLFFPQASFTMLGDLAQTVSPNASLGTFAAIAHLFPAAQTLSLRFTKSYRSTAEITAFAGAVLASADGAEPVGRHGAAPELYALPNETAAQPVILERLRRLKDEGFDSVGVITRTRAEAEALHRALAKDFPLHALLGAEDEFPKGAVVLPVYLAKGLEFDAVILADAGAEQYSLDEDRNLLYVACTRALHALTVLYSGAPSPLLPR